MSLFRSFVLFVGPTCESRQSFMYAYAAGIVLDFISVSEFWKRLRPAAIYDVVVFNRRNQSEDQCRLCHQLLDERQRVICIGCEPGQCSRCYSPETNWLTAVQRASDPVASEVGMT